MVAMGSGGAPLATTCEANGGFIATISIYSSMWLVYHVLCRPDVVPAIAFNLVFGIAVWSYLMTVITDPGTAECPEWQEWSSQRRRLGTEVVGPSTVEEAPLGPGRRKGRWSPGAATWCRDCEQERPERAHHCKSCRRCVIRMDHHCPWVSNCIGWRNNKLFMQMNLWSCCACAIWLLTLRGPNAIEAVESFLVDSSTMAVLPASAASSAVVLMIITGSIFGQTVAMACSNVTTVERSFEGRNPYVMPSSLENLRQLCGPLCSIRTLLPLQHARPALEKAFPVALPTDDERQKAIGYGAC